jgi:hypothetical protein
MPRPSLGVPYREFVERNQKHAKIASAIVGLEPALQKALAELILIRLFDDFQEAVSGIAYRLACGTPYVDGTSPTLLTAPARSAAGARALFESHGRGGSQKYEKWTNTRLIKQTTRFVIDQNGPFIRACDAHSLVIGEMQTVRNRIAHRNARTRKEFNIVLTRYFGGTPTGVTPGALLLTQRARPPRLQAYLTATRVIVRDCAKA